MTEVGASPAQFSNKARCFEYSKAQHCGIFIFLSFLQIPEGIPIRLKNSFSPAANIKTIFLKFISPKRFPYWKNSYSVEKGASSQKGPKHFFQVKNIYETQGPFD